MTLIDRAKKAATALTVAAGIVAALSLAMPQEAYAQRRGGGGWHGGGGFHGGHGGWHGAGWRGGGWRGGGWHGGSAGGATAVAGVTAGRLLPVW